MNRHERLSAILELVGRRNSVRVDEIAAEVDVSPATVRRDLEHLAEQQLIARTRGGAAATAVAYDLPLRHKTARRAPEKQRISAAAAQLVRSGTVVGLNGGTTTAEVARKIATRTDLGEQHNASALTVVTNALNIASELTVRPNIKIVVIGGVARQQSFELTGPLATRILEEITLDVLFLGVDAMDSVGTYAHHEGEASTNRLMAEKADRVIVVADSSKLQRRAFAQICPISVVDEVITNTDADSNFVHGLTELGISVSTV